MARTELNLFPSLLLTRLLLDWQLLTMFRRRPALARPRLWRPPRLSGLTAAPRPLSVVTAQRHPPLPPNHLLPEELLWGITSRVWLQGPWESDWSSIRCPLCLRPRDKSRGGLCPAGRGQGGQRLPSHLAANGFLRAKDTQAFGLRASGRRPCPWQAARNGTGPGFQPYVLDRVRTAACSRSQDTGAQARFWVMSEGKLRFGSDSLWGGLSPPKTLRLCRAGLPCSACLAGRRPPSPQGRGTGGARALPRVSGETVPGLTDFTIGVGGPGCRLPPTGGAPGWRPC